MVPSSAVDPRAEQAMTNKQPGPKAPEQGPLSPTAYSTPYPYPSARLLETEGEVINDFLLLTMYTSKRNIV